LLGIDVGRAETDVQPGDEGRPERERIADRSCGGNRLDDTGMLGVDWGRGESTEPRPRGEEAGASCHLERVARERFGDQLGVAQAQAAANVAALVEGS
jgi:hypothetical protein